MEYRPTVSQRAGIFLLYFRTDETFCRTQLDFRPGALQHLSDLFPALVSVQTLQVAV